MITALSTPDLFARLVGFDTSSGQSTRPIVDFICDYLDHADFTIEHFPCDNAERINLLVRLGPREQTERGLVLCGHLDVVPADESHWRSDPFVLTETNGTLVGRGSCDMKCAVALFVQHMRQLAATRLSHPLLLFLTCDEEIGSVGAQHFARRWPKDRLLPRNVIIGEPTSLHAVRMHKGHLKVRITVGGKAAHSGFPHLGVNAIEGAQEVLTDLIRLRQELEREYNESSPCFPQTPHPTLNIAQINGGVAFNVIPEQCSIDMGIRLLPGMDTQEMIDRLRAVCHSRAEVEVINDSPPLLVDDSAVVHRAACGVTGQADSCGVPFSSDGGVLHRDLGLDCVLLGPGSIDVAHRANEFVPISELHKADEMYGLLIRQFCMEDDARA